VGVIEGGEKLIDLPVPELYDLPRDPKESRNRYEADRRTVFALRKALAAAAPNKSAAASGRSVDSEEQSRLLSLGYLTGTSAGKASYSAADDPKNLIALDHDLHESIALYQKGDLSGALALARKLVAARPDMPIAQEMLAFLLGQNEHPDEAIDVLRRNIAAGRGNDAMRIRLGLMLSESGRAREAVDVLRPYAARKDPDLLNAYGIALADGGDVAAAEEQFRRILADDPRNARAYQNLGIIALRSGREVQARQYLTQALALDARLPLALNTLGVADARGGDFASAIDHWSQAVAFNPALLDAQYNLGMVAASQHRPDLARKALEAYLARAPESRFVHERAEARSVLAQLR
jgi:Flp pilus assembly protein TadD